MLEEATQKTCGQTPLPAAGPILLICKVQGLSVSVRAWVQGWVTGNPPSPTQPACKETKGSPAMP